MHSSKKHGSGKIAFVHLLTERKCRSCQLLKSIKEFRHRYRGKQLVIETTCLICERLYKKNKYHQTTSPEKRKQYRLNRIKKRQEYDNYRYNNDINYHLRKLVSHAIRINLKKTMGKKQTSCLPCLPYSIIELKQHLETQFEPWMNWQNHGRYHCQSWNDADSSTWTWQIDHIIPQSDLPYTSMNDDNFKQCWTLSNLRPLSSKQNLLDGTNKSRHNK